MKNNISRKQIALIGLVLSLSVGVFLYRWLIANKLEQTSALFIGLPAVLAIALSLVPAKSVTGMTVQGTLVFLLMSGIVLGEGLVCILMASPLFIGIAVIVGRFVQKFENPNKGRFFAFVFLLPFTLEGIHPLFTFSRHQEVVIKKEFTISSSEIEKSLARRLELKTNLPLFLRLGFPIPSRSKGEGLALGSKRCLYFSGGEGQPGETCVQVTSRGHNRIVFEKTKDESHISHWLNWKKSIISWKKSENNKMEISWMITYDRALDPAWYFAPFEKYAVRLVGEYGMAHYFGNK